MSRGLRRTFLGLAATCWCFASMRPGCWQPLLDRSGELLPLECPEADLWLFNVLTVVDALDEEKSELVRFDDGDILDVERYVFRPDLTEGLAVFKVPQLLRGPLFLGDEFVRAVKAAGLRGPEFTQLWP
ncbi:hypothetical protein IVA95_30170 [Bradyrhizobium sp. 157]|uniref:imm11 family protein n=1 Tax=Bradyrhizobium sp. 157 TaxID=2782631 RepID=UPI001FFA6B0D|nr:DUF1629 domain-containing protein [Bradyrhizobium sp. 157]MCK1641696.1 hypothetical protein [Bradyrhizobium sp. 157]